MISFFGVKNIEEIDFPKLVRQLPNRPSGWNPFSTQGQYIRAILESYPILLQHEINTPRRLAHFIGQGLVETNFLQAKAENLNYSPAQLKKVFGHKFASDAEIAAYANKPEKIANRVYADRMQNGNEASGDGWRYRGRGFFQITGKQNYIKYGELAGLDLVGEPEIMERNLKRSVQVAAAYFQRTGLADFADRDDVAGVSRGINRGDPCSRAPAHDEAKRIQWTAAAAALVRDPTTLLAAGAVSGAQSTLGVGSMGDRVREVQAWLDTLGYAVGAADGVYGPATRRAVLAFQDEHSLPVTGAVDEATHVALRRALDIPVAPGESPADAADPPPAVTDAPAPTPIVEVPAPQPSVDARPEENVAPDPTPQAAPETLAEAPLTPPAPAMTSPEPAADAEPIAPEAPAVAEAAPEAPTPAPAAAPLIFQAPPEAPPEQPPEARPPSA